MSIKKILHIYFQGFWVSERNTYVNYFKHVQALALKIYQNIQNMHYF